MPPGRAPARGIRRGASSASSRAPASTDESTAARPESRTASATPGPSSTPRGASSTRGTRAPIAGRFRPKVIRRDEAERDSIARLEEEKASRRAAEERRAQGRSRFRSKRSRGDAMGARGGFGRGITGGASGPFSGSGAGGGGFRSTSGGGGWSGGGGGGGGGGGPGGSRGAGSSRGIKGEGRGFNETDPDRYRETRINADKLHTHMPQDELNSDDEATMAALSGQSASVLPMGMYRREHKEEGVIVATTAELEAAEKATGAEESLFVEGSPDEGQFPEQPPEEGVWDTGKPKPIPVKKEVSGSDVPMADMDEPKTQIKPKKVLPQEPEDRLHESDLHLLANELGNVTITENEETKTDGPSDKDGRLYLFQFPPMLPPLNKSAAAAPPKSAVKPEPDDTNMLGTTPVADPNPVDLTEEKPSPNDSEDDDAEKDDPEETHGFMSSLLKEGGLVGKLNVRKSGKVELDWGGRILDLGPAVGMNFLTTAVIIEENDTKPGPGLIGGDGIGMGKIMGRFVTAPVWEEEDDWEVDSADLEWNQTS